MDKLSLIRNVTQQAYSAKRHPLWLALAGMYFSYVDGIDVVINLASGPLEQGGDSRQILATKFDPAEVQSEWSVRANATDGVYDALSYAPRLDLGVGPFNTTRQRRDEDRALIAQRAAEHPFMAHLRHVVKQQNQGGFFQNQNPRCMLAIELEHSATKRVAGPTAPGRRFNRNLREGS